MVEKCVVFGCSNSRNKEKGISMHKIPSDNGPRPEVAEEWNGVLFLRLS